MTFDTKHVLMGIAFSTIVYVFVSSVLVGDLVVGDFV